MHPNDFIRLVYYQIAVGLLMVRKKEREKKREKERKREIF